MSYFAINLNHFPESLQHKVAPTDSRRRGDERAHEQGDMENAEKLKDIAEFKQRAVRKYREV
jgi:hypothetical protein